MAVVSQSTSSSIFSLLSERMSTLARASGGMAFTLAPPSMKPTLKLDFGGAFKRASENWEMARLHADVFFDARREHGVEVRGERDVGSFGSRIGHGHHVARAIDMAFPSQIAELRQDPLGALLFEESGRGHAAKLQVNVVDPLLLAREPLEALAHAAQIGCFADQAGDRCEICRHAPSV